MNTWHIFSWMSTIVTFIFFIWFLKTPKLVKKDDSNYKKNRYSGNEYIYSPIGLRLWTLLLAILLAYIPIFNIIGVIVACVVMSEAVGDLNWETVFESKTNWLSKGVNFFNKEWFSKKNDDADNS